MKHILTSLLLIVCTYSISSAQNGTEIGIMGGVSLYSGDLSVNEFGIYLEEANLAFGMFARFNLGRTAALRLGILQGRLTGDDANTDRVRDLAFRTRLTEFSLIGEINLFKLGRYNNRGIMPYLFGGAAVFRFDPEVPFDGDYVAVQPLGTEGQGLPGYEAPYSLTQFAIPAGIGVKLMLSDAITLGLEFGGRKTFTDHLDDVSSQPVNYFDVLEGNGELAATLSNPTLQDPDAANADYIRGGDADDWYYFGGATLSFRLNGTGGRRGYQNGKSMGCPVW